MSDEIIARMNSQIYKWIINDWSHWVQILWDIDLSEWEFGEWDITTINKKELFTKLFNIILTGDPTKPINVENVVAGRWTWIIPNEINDILYDENTWILSWYWVKYNQLEENFRGKKGEKNN
jgi:hypothetical protein